MRLRISAVSSADLSGSPLSSPPAVIALPWGTSILMERSPAAHGLSLSLLSSAAARGISANGKGSRMVTVLTRRGASVAKARGVWAGCLCGRGHPQQSHEQRFQKPVNRALGSSVFGSVQCGQTTRAGHWTEKNAALRIACNLPPTFHFPRCRCRCLTAKAQSHSPHYRVFGPHECGSQSNSETPGPIFTRGPSDARETTPKLVLFLPGT